MGLLSAAGVLGGARPRTEAAEVIDAPSARRAALWRFDTCAHVAERSGALPPRGKEDSLPGGGQVQEAPVVIFEKGHRAAWERERADGPEASARGSPRSRKLAIERRAAGRRSLVPRARQRTRSRVRREGTGGRRRVRTRFVEGSGGTHDQYRRTAPLASRRRFARREPSGRSSSRGSEFIDQPRETQDGRKRALSWHLGSWGAGGSVRAGGSPRAPRGARRVLMCSRGEGLRARNCSGGGAGPKRPLRVLAAQSEGGWARSRGAEPFQVAHAFL